MAAKLTWEYDEDGRNIIIRKKKGKLTVDEIFRFLHEREQLNAFDGDLALIAFRVNGERDMYPTYLTYEDEGDSQEVIMVGDGDGCPLCGKNELFPTYCPACGAKRILPKEERT